MMEKLKRCPFCGSVPTCGIEHYESTGAEIKLAAVVECKKCGIKKRKIFKATEYTGLVPFLQYNKAFEDVVDEWNWRVDDD